jgi:hypothetical protein
VVVQKQPTTIYAVQNARGGDVKDCSMAVDRCPNCGSTNIEPTSSDRLRNGHRCRDCGHVFPLLAIATLFNTAVTTAATVFSMATAPLIAFPNALKEAGDYAKRLLDGDAGDGCPQASAPLPPRWLSGDADAYNVLLKVLSARDNSPIEGARIEVNFGGADPHNRVTVIGAPSGTPIFFGMQRFPVELRSGVTDRLRLASTIVESLSGHG